MNRQVNPISPCPFSACLLPTSPLFLSALWSATGYKFSTAYNCLVSGESHLWAFSREKKDTRSSWFWEQELTSAGKGCSLSGTLPCFARHLTHTELNTGLPTELSKLWARQCFPSPSPGNLLHLFHREQIK